VSMTGERVYVVGHSDRELLRLQRQGAFYAEFTRKVMLKAGLAPGMRVLDVGCGVGDVAIEAARIVGATGQVVAIDQSATALERAEARTRRSGYRNIDYLEGDFHDLPADEPFDAVVGRFILMHVPDPRAAVGALLPHVRAGGAIAFVEMDLSSAQIVPQFPLAVQALGWIGEIYRRDDVTSDTGALLFDIYDSFGLKPSMEAVARVEGGADADVYEYLAETIRSLLPRIVANGVATEQEIDVDSLAERVRCASIEARSCWFYPRMVGAWARKDA